MKKTLKQKVRQMIVARNALERIEKTLPRDGFGQRQLRELALEVMCSAKYAHRDLPYYLAIRAI